MCLLSRLNRYTDFNKILREDTLILGKNYIADTYIHVGTAPCKDQVKYKLESLLVLERFGCLLLFHKNYWTDLGKTVLLLIALKGKKYIYESS